MIRMNYGHATIEVIEDKRNVKTGTIVETVCDWLGLVWVRHEVFAVMPSGNGYAYDLCDGGGTGWAPECNVRNFKECE